MSVVHLLNTGMQHAAERRRRFWLEPGRLVFVGRESFIRIYVDREDGDYVTRLYFTHRPVGPFPLQDAMRLDAATWVDLSSYCGVMAIPRAFETDHMERPVRVLMEFVTVDDGLRWTTPA